MKEALSYLLLGLSHLVTPDTQQDFVFAEGTTYWIRGPVHLYGTTTIEGGAVVKFEPHTLASLVFHGPVTCRTAPANPAFFVGRDDASVGHPLPGDPVDPATPRAFYGLALMDPTASYDLHDLRIRQARFGLVLYPGTTASIRHVQITDTDVAMSWWTDRPVHLGNALITRVREAFRGFRPVLQAEHITVHQAHYLQRWPTVPIRLVNSLLVDVHQTEGWQGEAVAIRDRGDDLFESYQGGAHYLSPFCGLQGTGTARIQAAWSDELLGRTTESPARLTGTLSGMLEIGPRLVLESAGPDPGYHYVALDAGLEAMEVRAGHLRIRPGTRVGLGNLQLGPGGHLDVAGSAAAPVRWIHPLRIHEAPPSSDCHWSLGGDAGQPASARFEHSTLQGSDTWYLTAGTGTDSLQVRHSTFDGASLVWHLATNSPTWGWTNNLWRHTSLQLESRAPAPFTFQHQEFLHGTLELSGPGGPFLIEHCLFHGVSLSAGPDTPIQHRANGYVGATDRWEPSHPRDWIHSDPPTFREGPLGNHYFDPGAPSMTGLVDGGLEPAYRYGLYWFTTRSEGTPDGETLVDLGYHYPATGADGVLDHDGDGLPSLEEDTNGNGRPDLGERLAYEADSDFDGWDDGLEVRLGLNPLQFGHVWNHPHRAGLKLHLPLE